MRNGTMRWALWWYMLGGRLLPSGHDRIGRWRRSIKRRFGAWGHLACASIDASRAAEGFAVAFRARHKP